MKILVVIPARGGSKGIPRKNVRFLLKKPLISYSVENALNSKFNLDVVVSTDDEEISRIATSLGAVIINRPSILSKDDVALDPVVFHAMNVMEKENNKIYDLVITMQPTSPLLKKETLDSAIQYLLNNDLDTVLTVFNKPHLSWTEKDGKYVKNYEKRLNRQYLAKNLIETGAIFISKREFIKENNRIGTNMSVFEISEAEAVDIDNPQDWWIAEKELSKKNIILRVDGYSEIGLGHIYRSLLLGYNLIGHNIRYVLSDKSDLGIKKIIDSNFPYSVIKNDFEILNLIKDFQINIIINDILDTNYEYIQMLKNENLRVVNFEDLGPGAILADAVINDLYEKKNDYPNQYWGSDYYCIRDEFILNKPSPLREEVKEILIIFGGTDPSNLTKRLFDTIKKIDYDQIHFTFIIGLGYKYLNDLIEESKKYNLNIDFVQDVKVMSDYMFKADIAVSSQGRTMLELASMCVPTIILAQNNREQHHEFGYLQNGFINLGLGTEVDDETIKQTLIWLIKSPQIRKQMKDQMIKKDLKKGIEKVKNIILNNTI
jgi:CMP-N-acetylneuraminic acid synthetase/spore coat polysaccharide biosynthesis predicted glycosyltransferase SpsG